METTNTTAFIFAVFIGATAFSLVLRGFSGDVLIGIALNELPFSPEGIVITVLFLKLSAGILP